MEDKTLENVNQGGGNPENKNPENKNINDAEAKKPTMGHGAMPANDKTDEKTDEKTNNKDNHKDMGLIGLFVIIVVINLVLTSGLIFLYDRFIAPKIVAVDIKGFVEKQRDLYVARKINDEQLKANLDAMEKKIKSMPKNTIMISADVMVGEHAKTIEP